MRNTIKKLVQKVTSQQAGIYIAGGFGVLFAILTVLPPYDNLPFTLLISLLYIEVVFWRSYRKTIKESIAAEESDLRMQGIVRFIDDQIDAISVNRPFTRVKKTKADGTTREYQLYAREIKKS